MALIIVISYYLLIFFNFIFESFLHIKRDILIVFCIIFLSQQEVIFKNFLMYGKMSR